MSKKILVVEDEQDLREALVDVLTQAGFVVTHAADGDEGLTKALAEHPDLILLDVIMPVMDGQTMLKKLRQDPWGKSVRVIMLTSTDDAKNVAEAYTSSVTDYLVKTHIDFDEFVKQIRIGIYS